jgi:hypothetical protein
MHSEPGVRSEPTVRLIRAYPEALGPMRADKAVLGTMPTMAFRHCEPMRTASSFGWYIFPPEDIALRFNGADVFYRTEEGAWEPLVNTYLPGSHETWDAHAPESLHGLVPSFLGRLPMPGLVQVWSGLLCATRPGWSVLVRPVVNLRQSFLYACSEGLVEADRFQPFPLFMNIQLLATDTVIEIPKLVPLFQIQPLRRETYGEEAHQLEETVGLDAQSMRPQDWAAYRKTIRVEGPGEPIETGQYTAATRKRGRHQPE